MTPHRPTNTPGSGSGFTSFDPVMYAPDPSDYLPFPRHQTVAVIDDRESARMALRALDAAGYTADDITVAHGPDGIEWLDLRGEHHGIRARLLRIAQLGGPTYDGMRADAADLGRGSFLFLVASRGEDENRRARAILAEYGARRIRHYSYGLIKTTPH